MESRWTVRTVLSHVAQCFAFISFACASWIALVQVIIGERPFTTASRSALDVCIMIIIAAGLAIIALKGFGVFAEALRTSVIPDAAAPTTQARPANDVVIVVVHPTGTQSVAQLSAVSPDATRCGASDSSNRAY